MNTVHRHGWYRFTRPTHNCIDSGHLIIIGLSTGIIVIKVHVRSSGNANQIIIQAINGTIDIVTVCLARRARPNHIRDSDIVNHQRIVRHLGEMTETKVNLLSFVCR